MSELSVKLDGKEVRNIHRLCKFLGFEYVGEFFSPGGTCRSLQYEGSVVRNNEQYYVIVSSREKGWSELRKCNWDICRETWTELKECAAYIYYKELPSCQYVFKTMEDLQHFLKGNKMILDEMHVHYDQKTIPAEKFEKWFETKE